MAQPTVLIFGATGRVGGAVLAALDALPDDRRPSIRVFARRPSAVPSTLHAVEIIAGDFDDSSALAKALLDITSVFLVTGDGRDQLAHELSVISAALAADGPHIVKLSAITAGLSPRVSFGCIHGEIEDRLRGIGLPFTILRPTMFFQSLELFAGPVKQSNRLIAPAGTGAIAMVDIADVAVVAAKVLIEPGHGGQTYELTGAAAPTLAEVAAALGRATGRGVLYTSPPSLVARIMMSVGGGMNWWLAGQVSDLFTAIRSGAEAHVSEDVAKLLGRPPISLDTYISDRLDFWSAAP